MRIEDACPSQGKIVRIHRLIQVKSHFEEPHAKGIITLQSFPDVAIDLGNIIEDIALALLSSGFRRQCFQNSVDGGADDLVQTIWVLTTDETRFGPTAPQELAARRIEKVDNDKTNRPLSRRLGSVEFGETDFCVLRGRKIILGIVADRCDRLPCPFQHDMISDRNPICHFPLGDSLWRRDFWPRQFRFGYTNREYLKLLRLVP